ncbi:hypothetical protein TNCV_3147431 [Trichonephila clavipes]|nr:hypothetical protein TNCV_3147431 [Trichonephila clavipes]
MVTQEVDVRNQGISLRGAASDQRVPWLSFQRGDFTFYTDARSFPSKTGWCPQTRETRSAPTVKVDSRLRDVGPAVRFTGIVR